MQIAIHRSIILLGHRHGILGRSSTPIRAAAVRTSSRATTWANFGTDRRNVSADQYILPVAVSISAGVAQYFGFPGVTPTAGTAIAMMLS